jgi:hypothetical protein
MYIGSRLVLVSLSLSLPPHIAILHKEPYLRLLYFAHGKGGKGAVASRRQRASAPWTGGDGQILIFPFLFLQQ